jgi:replicative DNA helicase
VENNRIENISIPFDVTNEQVIIVAACLDNEIRKGLTQRLRPDIFVVEKHKIIWDGMRELSRRDLDYDPATLHLITGGKVDVEYLKHLTSNASVLPPNLRHHAELLLWDRARIDCASGPLTEFLKLFKDPLCSPDKVKMACKGVLTALESNIFKHRAQDPTLLKDLSNKLLEAMRNETWPFNLPGLDHHENGYRRFNPGAAPGMTTVVTGCSGAGKSSFLCHVALAQGPGIKALDLKGLGRKVLFGAWEMQSEMLLNLMASLSLGIDRNMLFAGLLTKEEQKLLDEEKDYILSFIKFKDQPKGVSAAGKANLEALDDIYGMIADNNVEVAIFDLWERAFSFRYEYEEKTCLIRQQEIAKELKVHQILAAQQRLKDVEIRVDKRPTREGIKGSSGWVDISDTIIGTNLPALWKRVPNDTFEAVILKQRFGRWPLLVASPYDEKTGLIGNFHSEEYEQNSKTDIDNFFGKH